MSFSEPPWVICVSCPPETPTAGARRRGRRPRACRPAKSADRWRRLLLSGAPAPCRWRGRGRRRARRASEEHARPSSLSSSDVKPVFRTRIRSRRTRSSGESVSGPAISDSGVTSSRTLPVATSISKSDCCGSRGVGAQEEHLLRVRRQRCVRRSSQVEVARLREGAEQSPGRDRRRHAHRGAGMEDLVAVDVRYACDGGSRQGMRRARRRRARDEHGERHEAHGDAHRVRYAVGAAPRSAPDAEGERERRLRVAVARREVPRAHLAQDAPLDARVVDRGTRQPRARDARRSASMVHDTVTPPLSVGSFCASIS